MRLRAVGKRRHWPQKAADARMRFFARQWERFDRSQSATAFVLARSRLH
jgi:hypothetical protein